MIVSETERQDEYPGSESIFATESAIDEIDRLYRRSSSEKGNYEKWLFRQLRFLDCNNLSGLMDRKRVIEDDDGNSKVLLIAFREIKGSDYSKAIEVAKTGSEN